MSLWSRDRIDIFIGLHAIRIVRERVRGRKRNVRAKAIDCPNGWEVTLERALVKLRASKARVGVTLSNHFVRYALLSTIDGARTAELETVARHQLRAVHGERVDGWRIVVSTIERGKAALAAAIDAEVFNRLSELFSRLHLKLQSIEPLLSAAFNRCHTEVRRKPCWLVVAEPGRVCIAHVAGEKWSCLRNQRLRGAPRQELPRLIEQVRLAEGIGDDASRVVLVTHHHTLVEMAVRTPALASPAVAT